MIKRIMIMIILIVTIKKKIFVIFIITTIIFGWCWVGRGVEKMLLVKIFYLLEEIIALSHLRNLLEQASALSCTSTRRSCYNQFVTFVFRKKEKIDLWIKNTNMNRTTLSSWFKKSWFFIFFGSRIIVPFSYYFYW